MCAVCTKIRTIGGEIVTLARELIHFSQLKC